MPIVRVDPLPFCTEFDVAAANQLFQPVACTAAACDCSLHWNCRAAHAASNGEPHRSFRSTVLARIRNPRPPELVPTSVYHAFAHLADEEAAALGWATSLSGNHSCWFRPS